MNHRTIILGAFAPLTALPIVGLASTHDSLDHVIADPEAQVEAPAAQGEAPTSVDCNLHSATTTPSFPARTRRQVLTTGNEYVQFRHQLKSTNVDDPPGRTVPVCNNLKLATSTEFDAGEVHAFPYKQGGLDSIHVYDQCIDRPASGGGGYLHGTTNFVVGGAGYARACGVLGVDCTGFIAKAFDVGDDVYMNPSNVNGACRPKVTSIQAARPGDLIWRYSTNPRSHAMMIAGVNPSQGTVKVYEAGSAGCCFGDNSPRRSDIVKETLYNFGELTNSTNKFILCQPEGLVERIHNAFVRADGTGIYTSTCDVTSTGALTCSPSLSLVLFNSIGFSSAARIKDVSAISFSVNGAQTVLLRYLDADGTKEYERVCTETALSPAPNCTLPRTLPSPGLPNEFQAPIAGRFMFLYLDNGVRKVRNGYVQANGLASWSQTCDLSTGGTLDCDPSTHPFTRVSLAGITPDPGQSISDRYTFVYTVWTGSQWKQKLRGGFMQSDGKAVWSQNCEIAAGGAAVNCDAFTRYAGPSGIPQGVAVNHRLMYDASF